MVASANNGTMTQLRHAKIRASTQDKIPAIKLVIAIPLVLPAVE
jgi:hypothetical protein